MGTVNLTIISNDLFSGSADRLRTEIGSFWQTSEVTGDTTGTISSFNDEFDTENLSVLNQSQLLTSLRAQTEHLEIIDDKKLIPNYSIPVRITGDQSKFSNYDQWRTAVLGGTWGSKTYGGIYTTSEYENIVVDLQLPYGNMEANEVEDRYAASKIIKINYDYNQYLYEYQNYIGQSSISEHELFNFYLAADYSIINNNSSMSEEQILTLYPEEWYNFVSREDAYSDVFTLFDTNPNAIPYSLPSYVKKTDNEVTRKNTYLSKNYLTGAFVLSPLSSSTIDWAKNKLKNILFDNDSVTSFNNYLTSTPIYKRLPHNINISFPKIYTQNKTTNNVFATNIINNNLDSLFLKTLYKVFNGETNELVTNDKTYEYTTDYYNRSDDTTSEVFDSESRAYREVDYLDFLRYCYNTYNFTGQNDDYIFLGPNNLKRQSSLESSNRYRYFNTSNTINTIKDAFSYLKDSFLIKDDNLTDVFSTGSYSEVLAYRIEKVGGTGTGITNTQNALQNFWFFNTTDENDINYYDTQVKYGTDYTYNVFAYVLAVGVKYKTDNLVLGRSLGCEDDSGRVGIEIYDPFTGESSPELFESTLTVGGVTEDTGAEFLDIGSASNVYGEVTQILTEDPYIADFTMEYEPFVKIIEVPVYSKTLKVLDNPGNRLQIVPYQINDASRKIAFDLTYGSFSLSKFPSVVTSADQKYKDDYLHANDLMENDEIQNESISRPSTIQVFQTTEMPTSISSFDGFLKKTINLDISNDRVNTNINANCEEVVKTNTKYYYLFRVLNQSNEISHISDVYEVQLVNDGGYNYAIFNTYNERELGRVNNTQISKGLKKIFQLRPNLTQQLFNYDNVDFTKAASSQAPKLKIGNADDLIWDKTFKVRLTSKKTNKKIDLNITYTLNSQ